MKKEYPSREKKEKKIRQTKKDKLIKQRTLNNSLMKSLEKRLEELKTEVKILNLQIQIEDLKHPPKAMFDTPHHILEPGLKYCVKHY